MPVLAMKALCGYHLRASHTGSSNGGFMNHRNRAAVAVGAVLLATAAAAVSAARQRPAAGVAQARQAEQITVYRSPG
jgi:hypothetical protein